MVEPASRYHLQIADSQTKGYMPVIKRMAVLALLMLALSGCFTEANYHPYSGVQGKNPTATGSFIDSNYAVATYYGYPPHPHLV